MNIDLVTYVKDEVAKAHEASHVPEKEATLSPLGRSTSKGEVEGAILHHLKSAGSVELDKSAKAIIAKIIKRTY